MNKPSSRDVVIALLASVFGPKAAHAITVALSAVCG